MKRLLHIGLLLVALLGLMGQSTAMTMAPARATATATATAIATQETLQVSMAGMDCMDMANAPVPADSPCKKITLQCMAAMGCAPLVLIEPVGSSTPQLMAARDKTAMPLTARLWGRSYGPEPDPPSFLI